VTTEFDQMMWIGNVRALPFPEQLRAARLAGYTQMSVTPLQYTQLLADGMSPTEMRQRAADNGVQLSHLDPLTRWSRSWLPENMPDAESFFAFTTDEFLRIAVELEATSLTAISTGPLGSVSINQMTEEFAALCRRAAGEGIRCDLEFIPLDWGIPDLKTAARILEDCGDPSAGLVFDFWCFMRGDPDWQALESFPGHRISHVQLCDAEAQMPAGRAPVDDGLQHRLPPGLGQFDVTRLLRTLVDIGGLRRLGPEIFSAVFDSLPAEEIATICRGSLVDALNAAGIEQALGPIDDSWRERFTTAERRHRQGGHTGSGVKRAHP